MFLKKSFLAGFCIISTMFSSSVFAQVEGITFSDTDDTGVFEISFGFDTAAPFVIDQAGTENAFDVLNDTFGSELFLLDTGPIASFGFVESGDLIDPNDSATTSGFIDSSGTPLDLEAPAIAGDDVLIGFLTTDDLVGYFTASFDDPDGLGDPPDFEGTITLSSGVISTVSGAALVVAVPEPSSIFALGCCAIVATLRRRKQAA